MSMRWYRALRTRIGFFVLLAGVVVSAAPTGAVGGVYPILHATPAASGVPSAPVTPAAPPANGPKLTAKAVLVREDSEGRALYAKAADTQYAPASTIKMLTALTALKLGQPGDTVTIIKDDLVGGSTMNLQAGDTLTLGSLLQGLLIPSGNDAAMAIARLEGTKLPEAAQIGGVAAFINEMNRVGLSLGLTGTKAVNPHGLDAPGMVSTATDLTLLAEHILADPVLAPIVRTKETKAPSQFGSYPLVNTNELLGTPGVIGVKTGTEDSVGQNLVLAVNEGNHRLIITIIGSDDRFADARALLAYVRANWSWMTLGDPQALPGLARALIAWNVAPGPAARKTLLMDRATRAQLHYRLVLGVPDDPAPGASAMPSAMPGATATTMGAMSGGGGTRGVILYVLGDREVARAPLVERPPPVAATPVSAASATAMPATPVRIGVAGTVARP